MVVTEKKVVSISGVKPCGIFLSFWLRAWS